MHENNVRSRFCRQYQMHNDCWAMSLKSRETADKIKKERKSKIWFAEKECLTVAQYDFNLLTKVNKKKDVKNGRHQK